MNRIIKYISFVCLTALLVISCSTKKNTSLTRAWHGFTAKYNIYYNGTLAYIDGSLEKENGNKDNFTERLPLYTVGNKTSRELGKSNFETAITKAEKAIQLHSIKAKPEWTKNRRKTAADIEWLSRKEYNPFLWKAWMLMGRSQFYKGDFDEAAATFSYMSRLYKGQPAIYGKARAWLAKCYIESDWIYDAEDVIRNMERDSINWRAQKEWNYTYCDYYLHTDNLPKAVEYLKLVIKQEMRSKQRAREYYLLGQIEAAQGHNAEAFRAFKKVIRQNPPYQLEFNARISMTEVSAKGQAKKMISRLKRMARNDNNKDYLDQVYYAIGNIYLAEKDTTNAIAAYEKGNAKATRSGIEKGVLLLHLGDLYWQLEKYSDAKRCYGEAIGLLDKERPDYQQLSDRSKVLDELCPYTDAVYLQDSLQVLAKLPEKERNAAIDRVIDALKKKEKEEAAKAAEQQAAENEQKYGNQDSKIKNNQPVNKPVVNNTQKETTFYFYNTQAVTQGKQTFQRIWGKRANADNWRRNNKTVVGGTETDVTDSIDNLSPELQDSIARADSINKQQEEKMDSSVNDPHKREYYLAQIPFTEEQVAASNEIIKDGLYHSGVIFKDKLDNLKLSEKQFKRLLTQYPEYNPKDEMFYHLFLLYSRMNLPDTAKIYVDSLKEEYPESKWTIVLTDPYFEENARFGTHLEDSLYGATYEAFKVDKFKEVYDNAEVSAKRFPLGQNRDRFIFIHGLTKLNDGDVKTCIADMDTIVKSYPQSSVAEMAGMIINGVKEGRQLYGAKFDLSDVWNRRNIILNDSLADSTHVFSPERNTDFQFIFAYAPDSVNENQLLFQLARYNFTNFFVRSFDLSIEDVYGMRHMVVSGFRNFDEARQYGRMIEQQESIRKAAGKSKTLIISEQNLALIGGRYSYNDYDTFYVHHFAPLTIINAEQLYEPVPKEKSGTKISQEERAEHGEVQQEPGTEQSQEDGQEDVEVITPQKKVDDDPVPVLLPTEEVAPHGAKPVEPKKELAPEEIADQRKAENSSMQIAEPTTSEVKKADDGLQIAEPATPEVKKADDGLQIDEATTPEVKKEDDGIQVVDTPQNDVKVGAEPQVEDNTILDTPEVTTPQQQQQEELVIPEVTTPQQQQQEELVIPEEKTEPQQQATTKEDDNIVLEDSKPEQKQETTDDNIILDDTKPEQQSATKEDDNIILDDSTSEQQTTKEDDNIILDDSKDQKESTEGLEDEYYELDGF